MFRWRTALFLVAASSIVIAGISTLWDAFLPAAPPRVTQISVLQVWADRYGPSSDGAAGYDRAYKLEVKADSPLQMGKDAPIKFSIKDVANGLNIDPNAMLKIHLESNSFDIVPSDPVDLPLKEGQEFTFVVAPKSVGEKILRYEDAVWFKDFGDDLSEIYPAGPPSEFSNLKDDARTITIVVLPVPVVLGLSETHIQMIQLISASIGFPALLLLLIQLLISKKKIRMPRKYIPPSSSQPTVDE